MSFVGNEFMLGAAPDEFAQSARTQVNPGDKSVISRPRRCNGVGENRQGRAGAVGKFLGCEHVPGFNRRLYIRDLVRTMLNGRT